MPRVWWLHATHEKFLYLGVWLPHVKESYDVRWRYFYQFSYLPKTKVKWVGGETQNPSTPKHKD